MDGSLEFSVVAVKLEFDTESDNQSSDQHPFQEGYWAWSICLEYAILSEEGLGKRELGQQLVSLMDRSNLKRSNLKRINSSSGGKTR